jgi:hypothetical protein
MPPSSSHGAPRVRAGLVRDLLAGLASLLLLSLPVPGSASVLDDTPYGTDPAFLGGAIGGDAYAANLTGSNRNSTARRVALGSNGEVIVASLVKQPGGAQSNGLWNLGLARYAQDGTRLTWSNPGPAYGHFNNQYVVYPNAAGALYREIRGLVRVNDNLVVLVETQSTAGPDLTVMVFGMDGGFRAGLTPFLLEYSEGGALAHYPGNGGEQIVVVGNILTPGGPARSRPVFRRYQLATSGVLTAQTPRVDLAMPGCVNAGWECFVTAVASTTGLFTDTPRIYAAGIYRAPEPANEFALVGRFDAGGNRSAGFNPSNVIYSLTDTAVGIGYTRPVDLGLRERHFPSNDQLFLLAAISRPCRPGAVLNKIDHVGASSATVRFGGSAATGQICSLVGRTSDYPTAVEVAADRIAVVGYSETTPLLVGSDTVVDGSLAVFDNSLTSGAMSMLDMRDFSYPIGGPREQYFVPWGLTAGAGAGRFTAVGSLRYPDRDEVPANLRGKFYTAITRFRPDRIFGTGLD